MSVARRMANSGRDPGNLILANAYAGQAGGDHDSRHGERGGDEAVAEKEAEARARPRLSVVGPLGNGGQKSGLTGNGLTRVIVSPAVFREVLSM